MRFTRVIAAIVIGASASLSQLDAQTLRNAAPPAEFPPASFKGKQYVDSRGCIYIRAGIDGNTTWVPRVTRDRKQVCGYKPTAVAGATTTAPATPAPREITLDTPPAQAPAPRQAAPAANTTPRTAAAPVATPAPQRAAAPVRSTPVRTVPAPTVRTVRKVPATSVTPRTTVAKRVPSGTVAAPRKTPVATPTASPTATGGCPNASAFSQRYINQTGVRCGPQAEPPITYGRGWDRSSALTPRATAPAVVAAGTRRAASDGVPMSLETRIVAKHIYDDRQNTTNVTVPEGYRPVWTDDRLNPHRAEHTLRPPVALSNFKPPQGYRAVDREDGRLNPNRGIRTAQGDAATSRIWTDTLPRELRPVETNPRTITVIHPERTYKNSAPAPQLIRLSSRNAPDSSAPQAESRSKPSYVRVATYGSDADARRVAQALAGQGLPVRLGTIKRRSGDVRVVLAGPYADRDRAARTLNQLRAAGYGGATLTR